MPSCFSGFWGFKLSSLCLHSRYYTHQAISPPPDQIFLFLFITKNPFIFIYVCVFSACMYMCAWYTQRSEEGVRFPATGVNNGCEPPFGCRASKLGLLEGQQGFPSPQHPSPNLVKKLKILRKPNKRLFSHTRTQLHVFLISHRSV